MVYVTRTYTKGIYIIYADSLNYLTVGILLFVMQVVK